MNTKSLAFVVSMVLSILTINAKAEINAYWENSVWQAAGRHAGVKPEIVYAIAIRESGMRWKDGRVRPWPWTVNSPLGPGRYASKEQAYAAIQKLKLSGVKNIDVGWMQLNLGQHGRWLENYDYMDPKTNIMLAAVVLKHAMDASNGNVALAAGRYHSWQRERGQAYSNGIRATSLSVSRLLEKTTNP